MLHDEFLSTLQSVANVRLISSLRDPRLGFPAENDIRIFLPDIHLITEKRRKEGKYRYASNDTRLLTNVLFLRSQNGKRRPARSIPQSSCINSAIFWTCGARPRRRASNSMPRHESKKTMKTSCSR